MCTVVFIPNNGKYYLASLRDESPLRPRAETVKLNIESGIQFLAPIDALAGGTWIGVNEFGNILILLNGGFENHTRKQYYRKSRGLIVLELLNSIVPVVDWNLMNLEEIEPFTLIVWSDSNLFQLVWDGNHKHKSMLDIAIPHIWSSATLYSPTIKNHRTSLFQQWTIQQPTISKESVFDFFASYTEKENGFLMHRNQVLKTLSYSFLTVDPHQKVRFDYTDLIAKTTISTSIDINKSLASCLVSDNHFNKPY